MNNKKFIFYHIFLYDKINYIINEQLNRLINNGLLDDSMLFVTILDNYNGLYNIDDENMSIINKYSSRIFFENKKYYEIITLKKIYEHSKLNDGNYLYIHTKGCTRVNDQNNGKYSYKNVENWRRLLEHFTIDHWMLCNENLNYFDLVGSNYMKKNYLGYNPAHYSGNFWWTTSNFINKLPDPQIYLNSLNINRMDAEFWVGKIQHRALCLYPLPEKIEEHNRCYCLNIETEYFNKVIKNEFVNYE